CQLFGKAGCSPNSVCCYGSERTDANTTPRNADCYTSRVDLVSTRTAALFRTSSATSPTERQDAPSPSHPVAAPTNGARYVVRANRRDIRIDFFVEAVR